MAMEHSTDTALQIAALLSIGAGCQWLAWRMRLPAILPLLLVGLLLGPGLGMLNPDEFLGDLLFPFVSLGVAIILFEGSLTLRFSDIGTVTRVIRNLTSIGVLVTWGIMGLAAHQIAGLDWPLAMLFGALVTVTGPTVIMPMLRSIRPTARIANILRWEGILVDPIGAVLAVLVFEFIVTGVESESLFEFLKVVGVGTVWGISGGFILGQVLKRHLLPDYLDNYFALALVLLVFTASNSLGDESGLVAVTVMGMFLANQKDVDVEDLLSFKEHLTVVLISVLFILLAARLNVDQLNEILVPSLLILAVALFVARPIAVLMSSIGTSVSKKEMTLLSWIAPRGIVAAAVSSLFALRLESNGYEQAALLVPLTFMVIIGTVVIQSLTAGWLASKLGLSSRGEQGVLIVGSNKVALAIGEALLEQGMKVKVIDTRRQGLHEARMAGMETFYGNPLSEHAERYMDLTGYTHLMAISRSAEANAVVCDRYRHEFGPKRVFAIQSAGGDEDDDRQGLVQRLRANMLFARDLTWSKLASLLSQDVEIRATRLTDEFDFEAFVARWGNKATQLFAFDSENKLRVRVLDQSWHPETGWKLVSVLPLEQPDLDGPEAVNHPQDGIEQV